MVVSRGGLVQPPRRGRTWVLFGPWWDGRIDRVSTLDASGFVIEGANEDDLAAVSAPAGDVNGDGLDDVVVGAALAGTEGREGYGAAYVVFGKAGTSAVELSRYDAGEQTGGFRIAGPSEFSLAGSSVSTAGDVNADGLDDIVVGAPFSGSAYVVFGKTTTSPVDLALFDVNAQGVSGYRIDFPAPDYADGVSVAGGGDVNGDGLPDVLVGHVPHTYDSPGSVFVVFGKATPEPVDVVALASHGFEIQGRRAGDATGYSVADAGDLNDDGNSDVVIGAPRINYRARGGAAVVFGSAATDVVRLSDIGARGFLISGDRRGDNVGNAVGGGGDVDGDGLDDIVVGARDAGRFAGAAYVVYGRRGGDTIRLADLGPRGSRIEGVRSSPRRCDRPDWSWCPGDWFGHSVTGIGDVDGDRRADLLIGAYAAGTGRLGRSYIIRGR